MKKFAATLSLILSCFSNLSAQIIETRHFHEIIPHCTPDTLILLDIDETLLVTPQMLGCDEWVRHRIKQYTAAGKSQSEAFHQTIIELVAIRNLSHMELVEPGIDTLIQSLQDNGHCIMGLTTQGLELSIRTPQVLLANNIDLAKTAPIQKTHHINLDDHPRKIPGALFHKGILFTMGTAKGEALFTLCDENGITPKRIVFINDIASHLADVEKSAQERGIEFIGLRYSYCDARKAAFRPEIAEIQFTHSTVSKLLSDHEAHEILQSRK